MIEKINKKAIIFDLDGTLSESKQTIDGEIVQLLSKLLEKYIIGIISGESFEQFEVQALNSLSLNQEQYKKLFIMPTSGASLYRYDDQEWKVVYEEKLSESEVEQIRNSFGKALEGVEQETNETFGEVIEDRGTQVTYSALGQEAPIELKKTWDPDQKKRIAIVEKLSPLLPDFNIRIGGTTSVDVTKGGIDKGYGIEEFCSFLSIPKNEILFIGDSLFAGGNDSAVINIGIETISVKDVSETKKLILELLG